MVRRLAYIMLFFSTLLFSQNEEAHQTPEIVSKLEIGKRTEVPIETSAGETHYAFTFAEVVSDSRCPKGVNCIWAGEIEFVVNIENGINYERRIFKIGATPSEQNPVVITNEGKCVIVTNITPTPISGKKTNPNDYVMHFIVKRIPDTNNK